MALRRRNKKAEENPPTEGGSAETKTGGSRKRKPSETLSSVINESTAGPAIDLLKQNTAFALPDGKSWVVLLLNTMEIGGLSVKQKNDPAKGSIIELICSDAIEAIATRDMLNDDFIGFVPTEGTLSRMGEYSLLTKAPYYWGVFSPSASGDALDVYPVDGDEASYDIAVAISEGRMSLADALPGEWAAHGGSVEDAASTSEPESEPEAGLEPDPEPVADETAASATDDDPFPDEEGIDYSELADDAGDEDLSDFEDDEQGLFSDDADPQDGIELDYDHEDQDDEGDDQDGGDYQRYVEANYGREVDEDEVRGSIARRFLADDLDLSVDLDDFERIFSSDSEPVLFELPEDTSDWLGNQVERIVLDANARLTKLRQDNQASLRSLFVDTMSLHAQRTVEEVSIEREGSKFAALMRRADEDFKERRSSSQQELAEVRKEIRERFDAAAEARAEQAAATARSQYRDRNQAKLDHDLAEAGTALDRRQEEQLSHDKLTVQDMRRREAALRMDIGLTQVVSLLRQRQEEQREQERVVQGELIQEIRDYIDEHRKSDIARADALAEQLARSNAVTELRDRYNVDMERVRAEQAERERELQQQIIQVREEGLAKLKAEQAEYETSLFLEQERTGAQRTMISELNTQIGVLKHEFDEQYKGQIAALKAEKQSVVDELERSDYIQRRGNRIVAVLIVVLVLASLAVGALLGHWWGFSQADELSGAVVLFGAGFDPAGS